MSKKKDSPTRVIFDGVPIELPPGRHQLYWAIGYIAARLERGRQAVSVGMSSGLRPPCCDENKALFNRDSATAVSIATEARKLAAPCIETLALKLAADADDFAHGRVPS